MFSVLSVLSRSSRFEEKVPSTPIALPPRPALQLTSAARANPRGEGSRLSRSERRRKREALDPPPGGALFTHGRYKRSESIPDPAAQIRIGAPADDRCPYAFHLELNSERLEAPLDQSLGHVEEVR